MLLSIIQLIKCQINSDSMLGYINNNSPFSPSSVDEPLSPVKEREEKKENNLDTFPSNDFFDSLKIKEKPHKGFTEKKSYYNSDDNKPSPFKSNWKPEKEKVLRDKPSLSFDNDFGKSSTVLSDSGLDSGLDSSKSLVDDDKPQDAITENPIIISLPQGSIPTSTKSLKKTKEDNFKRIREEHLKKIEEEHFQKIKDYDIKNIKEDNLKYIKEKDDSRKKILKEEDSHKKNLEEDKEEPIIQIITIESNSSENSDDKKSEKKEKPFLKDSIESSIKSKPSQTKKESNNRKSIDEYIKKGIDNADLASFKSVENKSKPSVILISHTDETPSLTSSTSTQSTPSLNHSLSSDKNLKTKNTSKGLDGSGNGSGKKNTIIVKNMNKNSYKEENDFSNNVFDDGNKKSKKTGSSISEILLSPIIKTKDGILKEDDSIKMLLEIKNIEDSIKSMNSSMEVLKAKLSQFRSQMDNIIEKDEKKDESKESRDIVDYNIIEVTDQNE